MTVYAIGDIQGCLDDLKRLLDLLHYDPAVDTLWFTGDLVNRGPHSLATLRFVRDLGDGAITVLGNHDLHLLAVREGVRKQGPKDTLLDVLVATDCDELCHWLRHQPLLHHDATLGFTLVHAGLHPDWNLELALTLAHEVESVLRSDHYARLLKDMYGNTPVRWKKKHDGIDRLRLAINCFTRMRFVHESGRLDFDSKGPPASAPNKLKPWFEITDRKNTDLQILFGHWSTVGTVRTPGVFPLDRGCVWGGCLAAMNLQTRSLTEIPCR